MKFKFPLAMIATAALSAGLAGCVEDEVYMSSTASQPVTTTSYYTNVGPNDSYYSHGHHSRQVVRREVVTETPVIVNSTTYDVRPFHRHEGRATVTQTPPAPREDAAAPVVVQTPPAPREDAAPVVVQTPPAPREDAAPVVVQTSPAPAETTSTASVEQTPAAPVEVASNDSVTTTAAAPPE